MTQQKKTCVKKIKPAGWLALGVFSVLLVGLIGTGCRSCLGVNRLAPAPTPVPVDEGGGEIAAAPETPDTPVPTPDPDEAWETFMEAIYKCDSLEDVGDDLADYPESLDALTAGIEDLTLDQEWIEWCGENHCIKGVVCHIRRLVEFGPRNLECEGTTCRASVSVSSQGALYFMDDPPRQIVRPPVYTDHVPLRLIKGQLEYQSEEDTWIITSMDVTVLPEPPESPACDDCDS